MSYWTQETIVEMVFSAAQTMYQYVTLCNKNKCVKLSMRQKKGTEAVKIQDL